MLARLLRTSALPFALCLAPVLVFAIAVQVWPGTTPTSAMPSQRRTWFESLYLVGKNRLGFRGTPATPAAVPSIAKTEHGESGTGEPAAAFDSAKRPPATDSTAAPLRAGEIARRAIKDTWGIDVPLDALASPGGSDMPAQLSDAQKEKFEESLRFLMPRVKAINESLGTCYTQWQALHPPGNDTITALIATISDKGARPYTVIDQPKEASKPSGPVDPAKHDPWSVDRLPRKPVERVVTLPQDTAKAYIKEMRKLWKEINAESPDTWPQSLPPLDDQLSHTLTDTITVKDLATTQTAVTKMAEVRGFALAQRAKVIRLVELFVELGYKNDIGDQRLYPDALSKDELAMSEEASRHPSASGSDQASPDLATLMEEVHQREVVATRQRDQVRKSQEAAAAVGVKPTAEQLEVLRSLMQMMVTHSDEVTKFGTGIPAGMARGARLLVPDSTRLNAIISETADKVIRDKLDSYFKGMEHAIPSTLAGQFQHVWEQDLATASSLTFAELQLAFPERPFAAVLRQDTPMASVRLTSRTQPELGGTSFYLFFWDGKQWNYLDLELIPWSTISAVVPAAQGTKAVVATASQLEELRSQLQTITDLRLKGTLERAGELSRQFIPNEHQLDILLSKDIEPRKRERLNDSNQRFASIKQDKDLADFFLLQQDQDTVSVSATTLEELAIGYPKVKPDALLRRDVPLATALIYPGKEPKLKMWSPLISVFFWDGTRWRYQEWGLMH